MQPRIIVFFLDVDKAVAGAAVNGVVFRHGDFFEVAAFVERARADRGHGFGYVDFFKTVAVAERLFADYFNAVRKLDFQ